MIKNQNNNKKLSISFPITYDSFQITREYFLLAVEKLMQKFNIPKARACELAEDIIKLMITQNKPPSDLEHEIEDLGYDEWDFLREKSILEVIEEYGNLKTKPHSKINLCITFLRHLFFSFV